MAYQDGKGYAVCGDEGLHVLCHRGVRVRRMVRRVTVVTEVEGVHLSREVMG